MDLTDKQDEALADIQNKTRILFYGGSRSGKTFLILFILISRALRHKSRHLIVRKHSAHLTGPIIYDTLPKVAGLMGVTYTLNKQSQFITFKNGSEIWYGGLDDKERVEKILGTEYSTIFANEVSTISYHAIETVLTRLAENAGLSRVAYFDENPPSKLHWSFKLFVEHKNPETNEPITNPDAYAIKQMNPEDNDTLPEDYISQTLMNLSARKRKRYLEGEFSDLEGSLWNDTMINPYRLENLALINVKRVVIAIDPAVTKTDTSDETGIIIVAEDNRHNYYVVEDCTGKYTPNEWANLVDRKYKEHKADVVVCEVNNGGDLVESNIHTVNRNIKVKKIHSSRGKMVRAEPVAGIYEQGRVHHVGMFAKLEDELTTYDGSGASPNRMDALVFAISELSNEKIGIFVSKRI